MFEVPNCSAAGDAQSIYLFEINVLDEEQLDNDNNENDIQQAGET